MLRNLHRFFTLELDAVRDARDDGERERHYRLALAALAVEMTRADFEVSETERGALAAALRGAFGLGAEETRELIALADEHADASVSLHEFTTAINAHLAPEQKRHVIELLWELAYADGRVDHHEEHLVRKVADLIHVKHRDFIRAKLAAAEARKARS